MSQKDDVKLTAFLRFGAVSALVIVLIYLTELIVVAAYGLPPVFGTAENWLAALQRNRFLGIVQTFSLDIVAVGFHAPLYIALFFLLRSVTKGYATLVLSVALSFIGIAVYFASNTTFSMLYLSDRLSAATTDVQRSQILQSAQAVMAVWNGTGPIVATNLAGIAGILVSVVMLRTTMFRMAIAIAGIVGNALELGPPVTLLPPLYIRVDPYLVGLGGLILLFWYAAIALRLWKGADSG